jgi:hypothetical protein
MEEQVKTEPSKEDILRAQYQEWLLQPLTKVLFQHIEDHYKAFTNAMVKSCVDKSCTDSEIRMYAFGLRTLDTLRVVIKNPQQFIKEETK